MDPTAREERIGALLAELVSRRAEIPAFVSEVRAAQTDEDKNLVLDRWDASMKEIAAIHDELKSLESEERKLTHP